MDIQPIPGMSYNEAYQWQLAMLLEGKAECLEHFPEWSSRHGSVHCDLSKYFAYVTRHSEDLKTSQENLVSVDWLLNNNRRKMQTPEVLSLSIP